MRLVASLTDAAIVMTALAIVGLFVCAIIMSVRSLGTTGRAILAAVVTAWLLLGLALWYSGYGGWAQ